MNAFQHFERTIVKNYLLGSGIAVLGFGGLVMIRSLALSLKEAGTLLIILVSSALIMAVCEYFVYKKYTSSFSYIFTAPFPGTERALAAYSSVQKYPLHAAVRTITVHFLGMAIPAAIMAAFAIRIGLLPLPYTFILYAVLGALLTSCLHALIEFFLSFRAIKPLTKQIHDRLKQLGQNGMKPQNAYFISLKTKLFVCSLFLISFPISLFGIILLARKQQEYTETIFELYITYGIYVFTLLLTALIGTFMLARSIQDPIEDLKEGITSVRQGSLNLIDNAYTDEFHHVISGFNHMVDTIRERNREKDELLNSIYTVLAGAMDARDPYTAGHSIRVAGYAAEIGRLAGLNKEELELLNKASLVHDIGKIGVADSILQKEGRLTEEEYDQIKLHPVIGASIFEQYGVAEELRSLVPSIRSHHERYDGKGYPDGLSGQSIPLFGRIIAIADSFDAMTSSRPYRKGMTEEKALQIIQEGSGSQWDPSLAELFIGYRKARSDSEERRENVL